LSDSGWRQFNRQFAEIVPFPRRILDDPAILTQLAELAVRITDYQEHARRETNEGARGGLKAVLDSQ